MPEAAAKATGADVKNPKRFHGRKEPKVSPLGPVPGHLSPEEKQAWRDLAAEIPWLGASDRTILEGASRLRAKMTAGEFTVSLMTELRHVLSAMGATPAARSKVSAPSADDDDSDPLDEFLN
jgi:phage terminase small subunit